MDFAARWFAIAAFLMVAACGKETPRPPLQGKPQTKISFVTDWKAQAEHGGFYEAVAEGLYAKRGLDVRILQGSQHPRSLAVFRSILSLRDDRTELFVIRVGTFIHEIPFVLADCTLNALAEVVFAV